MPSSPPAAARAASASPSEPGTWCPRCLRRLVRRASRRAHATAPRPADVVLARSHRLTGAQQFSSTVRRGARAGSTTLVGHFLVEPGSTVPRVGFVVSRAVGNAVVRNRTQRRLRHLVADRFRTLPPGTRLVVRALPAAAAADSARLGDDLDRVLRRLVPAAEVGV